MHEGGMRCSDENFAGWEEEDGNGNGNGKSEREGGEEGGKTGKRRGRIKEERRIDGHTFGSGDVVLPLWEVEGVAVA
ncbi:hypothetical protein V502_05630 [Pseudogymnoascus sp. VKM F-4520 (FW-2644)]|nr:hypothetical protein V502_05630 [Pseudogymnoascus sp. VKM F-4520 (FW-2644)]